MWRGEHTRCRPHTAQTGDHTLMCAVGLCAHRMHDGHVAVAMCVCACAHTHRSQHTTSCVLIDAYSAILVHRCSSPHVMPVDIGQRPPFSNCTHQSGMHSNRLAKSAHACNYLYTRSYVAERPTRFTSRRFIELARIVRSHRIATITNALPLMPTIVSTGAACTRVRTLRAHPRTTDGVCECT